MTKLTGIQVKACAAQAFRRAFRAFGVFVLSLIARVKFRARATGVRIPKDEPAVILCNHSCVWDFAFLLAALRPRRARFVATSIEFEKNKLYAWMLDALGVISKKQGAADAACVRAILRAAEKGEIIALYAAGMTSFDGRPAWPAQSGTEKLIKLMNAPVYSAITNGGFISHPRYAHKSYRGRVEIRLTKLFTKEETRALSAAELKAGIDRALQFNDWDWQKTARVRFLGANRVAGISRVLYRCMHCQAEGTLTEKKNALVCSQCGMTAERDAFGWFHAKSGSCPERMDEWMDAQMRALKDEWANADARLDAHVSLLRPVNGGAGYEKTEEGTLTMDARALYFTGKAHTLTWTFTDFQYFVLNDRDFLHIYARDGAYRFVFDDTRLIAKWFFAHRALVRA